jgi:hypothetical protein
MGLREMTGVRLGGGVGFRKQVEDRCNPSPVNLGSGPAVAAAQLIPRLDGGQHGDDGHQFLTTSRAGVLDVDAKVASQLVCQQLTTEVNGFGGDGTVGCVTPLEQCQRVKLFMKVQSRRNKPRDPVVARRGWFAELEEVFEAFEHSPRGRVAQLVERREIPKHRGARDPGACGNRWGCWCRVAPENEVDVGVDDLQLSLEIVGTSSPGWVQRCAGVRHAN